MKRPQPHEKSPGAHFFPVLFNFSNEQLAGIGAVAVTYNAAEELIDDLVWTGWRLRFDPKEILTRIGGIDGKYALIKHAAKVWGMPDDITNALEETFSDNNFGLYKSYRDGVIHARIQDADTAVGWVVERRNKRKEVLLSTDALNGLAARLECITNELEALKWAYRIWIVRMEEGGDACPDKEPLEEEYRDAMTLYRKHLSHRQSLPPLPEFPEAPSTQTVWDRLAAYRAARARSDREEPQE